MGSLSVPVWSAEKQFAFTLVLALQVGAELSISPLNLVANLEISVFEILAIPSTFKVKSLYATVEYAAIVKSVANLVLPT